MAEAPAEPAPEAPKEEEEQKVGRNLEDKILTCHVSQVVPPCMDLSEFPLKEDYFEGRSQKTRFQFHPALLDLMFRHALTSRGRR